MLWKTGDTSAWLFTHGICTSFRYCNAQHSWTIKTAIQLQKSRYVIFTLQAGRKNIMSEDTSRFDHCKLNNVKLYLNSECYLYDDMNVDFETDGRFSTTRMHVSVKIITDYLESNQTVTSFRHNGPFVIIDCSRQNESIKSATMDVRSRIRL